MNGNLVTLKEILGIGTRRHFKAHFLYRYPLRIKNLFSWNLTFGKEKSDRRVNQVLDRVILYPPCFKAQIKIQK
jgi:hypothetical protein